jgi:hypothetical protein
MYVSGRKSGGFSVDFKVEVRSAAGVGGGFLPSMLFQVEYVKFYC